MIFTTFSYFLFLIPTALLFRLSGPRLRPWISVASGVMFFVYFSVTELAGWIGAACVAIFVWESSLRASDWMADEAFEDEIHLSPAGARAFSARLARAPVDIQTPRR